MTEEKSKQKNFRAGVLTGGATVGVIAALLYQSCAGDSNHISQNDTVDAGVGYDNDSSDAGASDDAFTIPACPDGQRCYSDYLICKEGEDCYSVANIDNLEQKLMECRKENEELSKRPKSCPSYMPKADPKAKECPEIPYIIQGE